MLFTAITHKKIKEAKTALASKKCDLTLAGQNNANALLLTMIMYLKTWNSEYLELAEQLLKEGADPGVPNNDNLSAFKVYLEARDKSLFDTPKLNSLYPAFIGGA